MNAVYALLGLTVLLGFVSILVVTIECGMTSAYYWRLAANLGHCSNQVRDPYLTFISISAESTW